MPGLARVLPAAATGTVGYLLQNEDVAANSFQGAKVGCPGGFDVIGGGVSMNGSTLNTSVRSTAPFDDADGDRKPDDGWRVFGNEGNVPQAMTGYAICSNRGSFRYVGAKPKVVGGARGSGTANCAQGERVVSGGVQVTKGASDTGIRLVASIPHGTLTNSKNDDGWKGIVDNASVLTPTMRTWAICARGVDTFGFEISAVLGPGQQDYLTPESCPAQSTVTGGGGVVLGAPGGTELASLYPLEEETDQWTAWETWVNNESPSLQEWEAYAVCTDI